MVVLDIIKNEPLYNSLYIIKIDISQGDIFQSQIRKEEKIQEVFHFYDYKVITINEDSLFNDYEIKFYEKDLELFRERQDEEYFVFDENESSEEFKNRKENFFTLGVIMPNLGYSLSYKKLYEYKNEYKFENFIELVFKGALEKMRFLHENEIYHGDIKPDNKKVY